MVVSVVGGRDICGRVGIGLLAWVVGEVVDAGLAAENVAALVDDTAVVVRLIVAVGTDKFVGIAVVVGEEENNLVGLEFGPDIEDVAEVAEETDDAEEVEKNEIVDENENANENENENGHVGAAGVVEAHMDLWAEMSLLDIHPLLL